MGLFSIFKRKNQEDPGNITDEAEKVRKGLPAGQFNTVSANGTMGLDAIYAFLQYDYESRGYNDALTNPDESYKSDNIKLFNHDLLILIDKSITYYEDLLKEIEFHISSRSRAGLIDLVEELKIRLQIINEHREKIKLIKEEAINGTGNTQRIALSYQRGFMKGLSAISQSKVFNSNL
jgi:hypothetical protein